MENKEPRRSRRIQEQQDLETPVGEGNVGVGEMEGSSQHKETPRSAGTFKKVLNYMNPFSGGKKIGSSTTSSSTSLKAEAEVELAKKVSLIQAEIDELEEALDLSQIEVDSIQSEVANLTEKINPEGAQYESEKVTFNKGELVALKSQLSKRSTDYKKLVVTTKRQLAEKKRQLSILAKEHDVTLANIEEEQRFSSDEEGDDERVRQEFTEWRSRCDPDARGATQTSLHANPTEPKVDDDSEEEFMSTKDEPFTVPPSKLPVAGDVPSSALDLIAQTLAKLSVNQGASSSNKFMARQTAGKDLPYFYGQPEEWPAFIASYRRTTEMCGFSDAENMERLRRCLKGEASKAVQCLMVSPNNLPQVMETLEDRFGKTKHVINSLIAKARQAPSVKDDKPQTMIDFGTAVVNLTATIQSLEAVTYLSNPQLISDLEEKLPYGIRIRWEMWRSAKGGAEDMGIFADWVKAELKMAYGMVSHQIKPEKAEDKGQGLRRRPVAAHAVQEPDRTNLPPKKECYICKSNGHWTSQCESMTKASPDERILIACDKNLCFSCFRNDHKTNKCQSRRVCEKDGCKMKHHSLLHGARSIREIREDKEKLQEVAQVHHLKATTLRYVQVVVSGPQGEEVAVALQDDGSNVFAMEESIRQRIGAIGEKIPLCMRTIAGDDHHPDSQSVSLKIRGGGEGAKVFGVDDVRSVKDLNLQRVSLDAEELKKKYPYLRNIPLKSFFNVKPKLLIGSSHFPLIQHLRTVEGGPGEPIAIKSRLGWSVILPGNGSVTECHRIVDHHCCNDARDDELHQLVKKSFLTEDFGVKITSAEPRSKEDTRALKIMEQTTVRGEDGIRFQTGLLWKQEDVMLPESRATAFNRLKCQERKMDKDPEFAKAYCAKMDEYLEKGYIRKIDPNVAKERKPRTWYLPHFGVTNPNKPGKLRLVFDAAAKSHGVSLNDALCQGPDLNNSLVSVLMRFRQYKYAFAGDIKDMFHRVFVRKEDRHSQRFLWRGMKRDREPDTYEMQVMVFGATSSPSSAQFAKNQNAEEHKNEFPAAAKAIKEDFYVDDYLDSKPTEEESIIQIKEVTGVNAKAGFEVCNWVANTPTILASIPEELRAKELTNLNFESDIPEGRVLGMWWSPTDDNFRFRLTFHRVPPEIAAGTRTPTKREVLKLVMSVFDPLGFLGHLVINAKILMQDIWRSEIGWDDVIPEHLEGKWTCFLGHLRRILEVSIPRCYSTLIPGCDSIELHVFGDASQQAFSAIAFIRVRNGLNVDVRMVMARTKVAPLKPLSMPRMEVQASLMGTRLAVRIKEELEFVFDRTVYWTDSTTVLKWIRNDARRFKPFVAHRLGEILETTDVPDWRWVPTALNVADDATRDGELCDLSPDSRWFNGPDFLREEESAWPKEKVKETPEIEEDDEEEVKLANVTEAEEASSLIDASRYSSYRKLTRIMAWIQRFIKNLRSHDHGKMGPLLEMFDRIPPLKVDEIIDAELTLFRMAQKTSFLKERGLLHGGKLIPRTSSLFRLSPYLDQSGNLRMKGRIQLGMIIPEETKNPIIMDRKNPVTKLLVSQQHQDLHHQGRATIASELRKRFWIVGMTAAVKEACSRCQMCRIRRAVPTLPEMGDLPEVRSVSHVRPFTNTGLDYFGPVEVVIGRRHEKRWVALFTCLSTRAVHLEVAASLTTDSAISAIRRFSARRGVPVKIYSDNGTNFHGANVELRKALDELDQSEMESKSSSMGIQWVFNPPAAPHMGGVWERLVGSVKRVLSGIMNREAYTEETLATFLCEAEAILNKRPLTEMSMDPDDPITLTPNHFLLGWTAGSQGEAEPSVDAVGVFDHKGDTLKKKSWRAAQALADEFWRRWVKEYFPTLTKRDKWHQPCPPLKIDDIVLVVDDQAKRNTWEKGRVMQVFPGKDGKVRVAEVRTQRGTYRRPVAKLALLDLTVDGASPIGGKNVEGEK